VAEPVQYNSSLKLYFRGARIYPAFIKHLNERHGFTAATEVLFGGCSAGGLATYLHADRMASLMPSSVTRFKALPVSGFFLFNSNLRGVPVYPTQMASVFKMQNSSAGLNAQCLKDNADAPHKCLFAQVRISFEFQLIVLIVILSLSSPPV
jgi:hypothetical protein